MNQQPKLITRIVVVSFIGLTGLLLSVLVVTLVERGGHYLIISMPSFFGQNLKSAEVFLATSIIEGVVGIITIAIAIWFIIKAFKKLRHLLEELPRNPLNPTVQLEYFGTQAVFGLWVGLIFVVIDVVSQAF